MVIQVMPDFLQNGRARQMTLPSGNSKLTTAGTASGLFLSLRGILKKKAGTKTAFRLF